MKTSSNTQPRHITSCCVQFDGVFVQQRYRKTKISTICKCFPHTEIPSIRWKCHIEAVYFKKQYFCQRKLHVGWNYSQSILWFLSHTFNRLSIVTSHMVSESTCFFRQINQHFNTSEDLTDSFQNVLSLKNS